MAGEGFVRCESGLPEWFPRIYLEQVAWNLLQALPYLVNYPYECTEQTLNRFLSTGIVTSVFERYPSVQ